MDEHTAYEQAYKNGYEQGLMDLPQFGEIIYQKQMEKMENDIYQEIVKVGISVDKDKIVKALTNAREFYKEGYEQGQRDAVRHGRWKLHRDGSGTCDQCHFTQKNVWDDDNAQHYCGVCGAKMDGGTDDANG